MLITKAAMFLFNNYTQALGILNDMPSAIEAITGSRTVQTSLYHQWLHQEWAYLGSRKTEPQASVDQTEYVALLMKMRAAR